MRHEPGEMVQLKLMHDAKTLTSSETVFYTESKTNNVPFVLLEVLDVNRTLMDVCSSQNVVLLMTNMTSTKWKWSPMNMAPDASSRRINTEKLRRRARVVQLVTAEPWEMGHAPRWRWQRPHDKWPPHRREAKEGREEGQSDAWLTCCRGLW